VSQRGIRQSVKVMLRAVISGDLDEGFVKYYMVANWVLLGLMVAVVSVVSSSDMALGVMVGGIIINLNGIGLERDCRRMLRVHTVVAYYGGFAVRLGLITLAVLASLLVFPEVLSPVGLFIGLSVGVINFYILVLVMVIHRVRFKEAA
jgi:hypothetical protein